jgi:hypothetical protein
MRKTALLLSLGFVLFVAGNTLALDVTHRALAVKSSNPPFSTVESTNPSPVIAQYDYDLALTNIGIDAISDECIEYCETWEFWVKAYNNGYEVVDCAEVIFTINGLEIGRVHVTGLYPGETRKYLVSFHVDWQQCEPFIIDGHVDWPLDENPANDDIEDEFTVPGEPVELLIRDSGIIANAWTWPAGLEYPDYAMGSKWQFNYSGLINYWEMAYTHMAGRYGGHAEFFVFAADENGDIIDNGQGGIMNMEFQFPERYWADYGFICYPICLPVEAGQTYYFVWSNRQSGVNYWCIDDDEDNPDWNWYKEEGVWHSGNVHDGDFVVRVGMEPVLAFLCESLTPVFCRGRYFYFKVTVSNPTSYNLSGTLTFRGHAGYDCDPHNTLIAIPSYKSYPTGTTEEYYYFNVPGSARPGHYSASIHGLLSGYEFFCCMNTDIVQCEPWKIGDNSTWELIQLDRPEVALPTVTELLQNYPNPFNDETNIAYTLAEAGNVTLKVYDICGRLVVTLLEGYEDTGPHLVTWDATDVSSGVYFYKLTCGDYSATKKMNLLR